MHRDVDVLRAVNNGRIGPVASAASGLRAPALRASLSARTYISLNIYRSVLGRGKRSQGPQHGKRCGHQS